MKKMMLVAAACALVASPAILSADTVTSVNVVGYYTVMIPSNSVALVTPVLENMEGGTIAELLGDEVPTGTIAYLWDRTAKAYASFTYFAEFGGNVWKDSENNTPTNIILRGDALWIDPQSDQDITITFAGEVPAEYNQAGTTTVHNITAADAVGYSYPVDVVWTNTTLAQSPNLKTVHFWNGSGWDTYNKFATFGGFTWDPAEATNKVIKAGEAFWVEMDAAEDWTETVPYDL